MLVSESEAAPLPELFLVELFLELGPELFFVELLLVPFFDVDVPLLCVVLWLLLPVVVVLVSDFVVQDARNATPSRQAMEERMDFFIG